MARNAMVAIPSGETQRKHVFFVSMHIHKTQKSQEQHDQRTLETSFRFETIVLEEKMMRNTMVVIPGGRPAADTREITDTMRSPMHTKDQNIVGSPYVVGNGRSRQAKN